MKRPPTCFIRDLPAHAAISVSSKTSQGEGTTKMFWVAPKPIPDKASHPNFAHVQSIEYAVHVDQTLGMLHNSRIQQHAAEKKGICGTCGLSAREKRKNTKLGRVALSGMVLVMDVRQLKECCAVGFPQQLQSMT